MGHPQIIGVLLAHGNHRVKILFRSQDIKGLVKPHAVVAGKYFAGAIIVLQYIHHTVNKAFIIGIDASLGNVQNIGKIFVEDSPLHPGLALDKALPEVGEMNIKGVVNISGNLDFMMLQNTRLFVVMSLADCISNAISYFINKALSNNTLISYD